MFGSLFAIKFHLMYLKCTAVLFAIFNERAKRASSVMFVFNRDFRYVRIYIREKTFKNVKKI